MKKPEESRGEWDYYKLLQTTASEEAFRPLADGGCSSSRPEPEESMPMQLDRRSLIAGGSALALGGLAAPGLPARRLRTRSSSAC